MEEQAQGTSGLKIPQSRQRQRPRSVFRYETGQESVVLDAHDRHGQSGRRSAFDWFDAAVLSHQLGQHLAKELKPLLPKKAVMRIIGFKRPP